MTGSYILLIELPEEKTISVGRLQSVHFHQGGYAYVGSAMGGFKSRLNRHVKKNKKPRWHIDYLLQEAVIKDILLCQTEHRIECTIAQSLKPRLDSVPGFGSSDCRCQSHLFFAPIEEVMKSTIMAALEELDIQPRLVPNPR